MSIKQGKLVKTRKVINFLEITAVYITQRELALKYKKPPDMVGRIEIVQFETGDDRKANIVVKSFLKFVPGEPLVNIESRVEFHKVNSVWIPRILKLKIGEITQDFVCEVTHEGTEYSYTVRGPVDPQSV